MAIDSILDGHDHIRNFAAARTGPGVYLLFDGRPAWNNCVYVGMSLIDTMVRVAAHRRDKDFTHVGIILPVTTTERFVRDIEGLVVEQFFERYGELPYYNVQRPWFSRTYDLRYIARRSNDVLFE